MGKEGVEVLVLDTLEVFVMPEAVVETEEWRLGVSGLKELAESLEVEWFRLRLLRLEAGDLYEGHWRVTVLMPRLVLVVAGMTSVTLPSAPGMIRRFGCFALQPGFSDEPLE